MCNHRQPKPKIIKEKSQALIRDIGFESASWILDENWQASRDSRRQLELKRVAWESPSFSQFRPRLKPRPKHPERHKNLRIQHHTGETSSLTYSLASISEQCFHYSLIMHDNCQPELWICTTCCTLNLAPRILLGNVHPQLFHSKPSPTL